MNAAQEQQFEKDYDKFLGAGFLFTAKDDKGCWTMDEALKRLRLYTRLYIRKNNANCPSVSAFRIVADALEAEGEIRPIVRDTAPEETFQELTVEAYRRMPVRQIQLKYRQNPAFKAQVDDFIAQGLI